MTTYPDATCKQCDRSFVRRSSFQRYCFEPKCTRKLLAKMRRQEVADRKAHEAAKKAELADTKRRKEAAKTRKDLTAEAQKAFNAFIRARDFGKPCICCGAAMNWVSDKPGGEIDAGHYLSIGSAPHMRFIEGNAHAQRKSCNKPGGAKRHAFRAGMVARIGLAAVEVLESDQTLRKYTSDDLRAIRDEYRARLKANKWA